MKYVNSSSNWLTQMVKTACVFPQHVTASVAVPKSRSPVEAKVMTPHQCEIPFIPYKAGSHIVQYQIKNSFKDSYKMFVVNKPDPQHCRVFGPGQPVTISLQGRRRRSGRYGECHYF